MRYLTLTSRVLGILFILLFIAACEGSDSGDEADSADGDRQADDTPDCRLTMGWDPWDPYHYRTPTGEVTGLDIELVEAAAEESGCEVDYKQGDFASLLQEIRQGEVDFLPGITPTAERETFARFSTPYRNETFNLWVRENEYGNYEDATLADLLEDGRRIGLTEGFIYGDEAEALMAQPEYENQLVTARIGDLNLLRLIDHDIDAMIEDTAVATSLQRRYGLEDEVEPLQPPLVSGEVQLMFSRESVDAETVEHFNRALETVIENGTRDEIVERYISD